MNCTAKAAKEEEEEEMRIIIRRHGFVPTGSGKGDHEVWSHSGLRITNNYYGKELDPYSFRSALRALGISPKEFGQSIHDKSALNRLCAKLDKLDRRLIPA